MSNLTLYYATNRNHLPPGQDSRWQPESYGKDFSADGHENLRFGRLTMEVNETEIRKHLKKKLAGMGTGDGESLASYFTERAKEATIRAFSESLDPNVPDKKQDEKHFGSQGFFDELKSEMMKSTDVLVYIHGFNVDWHESVGYAVALQRMLNRDSVGEERQKVMVVLFTWPSDGSAFPFRAYKADRADARDSGYAVGRAFLKLRDFLEKIREEARQAQTELCDQAIHLLCHSMGNYVLQNALDRIIQFNLGPTLPRMFEHIFLCSPDVDDTVFEKDQPMCRLNELTQRITIYYNREDNALMISDTTKSNPERLGTNGAARPFLVHNKVNQVDCTPVVSGIVEHSYYMSGNVNGDIKRSIDGLTQDSSLRERERTGELPNVWRMKRLRGY